ncbi:MAG: hypothetical protein AAF958_06560 [Planctomycetota bacterium]
MSNKTLCKLKDKELRLRVVVIAEGWDRANFLCRKCGRVAADKKWLCKAMAMKPKPPKDS